MKPLFVVLGVAPGSLGHEAVDRLPSTARASGVFRARRVVFVVPQPTPGRSS